MVVFKLCGGTTLKTVLLKCDSWPRMHQTLVVPTENYLMAYAQSWCPPSFHCWSQLLIRQEKQARCATVGCSTLNVKKKNGLSFWVCYLGMRFEPRRLCCSSCTQSCGSKSTEPNSPKTTSKLATCSDTRCSKWCARPIKRTSIYRLSTKTLPSCCLMARKRSLLRVAPILKLHSTTACNTSIWPFKSCFMLLTSKQTGCEKESKLFVVRSVWLSCTGWYSRNELVDHQT